MARGEHSAGPALLYLGATNIAKLPSAPRQILKDIHGRRTRPAGTIERQLRQSENMLAKWRRYSIWIDRFLATIFGVVMAVGSFLLIGYVILQAAHLLSRPWDKLGTLFLVSLLVIPILITAATVIGIIAGMYIYPKLRSWN
jgi:hypothetical protein